jgi:hypothetical protein
MRAAPAVLGFVGVVGGLIGLRSLRDATLSTHTTTIAANSRIELIVDASTHRSEAGQSIDEIVEAQIVACRLEVSSDVVGDIESLGDDRFRAVLTPSMDHTNQRQFRGCLEDWIIDHVKLDVVSLTTLDS